MNGEGSEAISFSSFRLPPSAFLLAPPEHRLRHAHMLAHLWESWVTLPMAQARGFSRPMRMHAPFAAVWENAIHGVGPALREGSVRARTFGEECSSLFVTCTNSL